MSASSKKKLRNEQQAVKLTEKQLAEQKEAKKLKLYTTAFVIVLVALLVVAVVFGVNSTLTGSGIRERKTIALTVGENQINNVEMNYYFIDSLNQYLSGDNSYMTQLGLLDTTVPLDQQTNPLTGQNWGEYMLEYATQNAKATYALADAAKAAGFVLPEESVNELNALEENLTFYAMIYGYEDADSYLKTLYGPGSSFESYKQYTETSLLSQAYYNAYTNALTYEDADLRAAEAENFNKYSSFTYNYYYMAASKFLEGGTTDAEGNTTYSDEETAASIKAVEAAAKALVADCATVEELDAAISALSINAEAESPVTSTLYEDTLYSNIANASVAQWLSESNRKEGDMTYIANDISGEIAGYYVIYFQSVNDNTFQLKNVRHILAAFEGGTTDSTTGTVTYSDEEKAAAKANAEEWLAQWKSGEATEESFAALANEKSADGDGTTGGLYQDIYPGQMVAPFETWCYDESRKAGDTGIVETTYGYHVMYFPGESETNFRDLMITSDLMAADLNDWYNTLLENTVITNGNTSYVDTGIVLSAG